MSLFHYTDIQAVQSVLENQIIWLTDVRFLSDSKELLDGVETLLEVLSGLELQSICDEKYIHRSVQYIENSLGDTVSFGIDEEPIYVFSLAKAENRLSQWRSYGSYAIEFDEIQVKEFIPSLHSCEYDQLKKNQMSEDALIQSIKVICKDIRANHGCIGFSSIDAVADLVETAVTFKHEEFFEEQEIRAISKLNEKPIQYRARDNKLIPYLELPISLDCIKRIHVGPMKDQELAYKSMSSFVRDLEREWQLESANTEYWLEVIKSTIPYREK